MSSKRKAGQAELDDGSPNNQKHPKVRVWRGKKTCFRLRSELFFLLGCYLGTSSAYYLERHTSPFGFIHSSIYPSIQTVPADTEPDTKTAAMTDATNQSLRALLDKHQHKAPAPDHKASHSNGTSKPAAMRVEAPEESAVAHPSAPALESSFRHYLYNKRMATGGVKKRIRDLDKFGSLGGGVTWSVEKTRKFASQWAEGDVRIAVFDQEADDALLFATADPDAVQFDLALNVLRADKDTNEIIAAKQKLFTHLNHKGVTKTHATYVEPLADPSKACDGGAVDAADALSAAEAAALVMECKGRRGYRRSISLLITAPCAALLHSLHAELARIPRKQRPILRCIIYSGAYNASQGSTVAPGETWNPIDGLKAISKLLRRTEILDISRFPCFKQPIVDKDGKQVLDSKQQPKADVPECMKNVYQLLKGIALPQRFEAVFHEYTIPFNCKLIRNTKLLAKPKNDEQKKICSDLTASPEWENLGKMYDACDGGRDKDAVYAYIKEARKVMTTEPAKQVMDPIKNDTLSIDGYLRDAPLADITIAVLLLLLKECPHMLTAVVGSEWIQEAGGVTSIGREWTTRPPSQAEDDDDDDDDSKSELIVMRPAIQTLPPAGVEALANVMRGMVLGAMAVDMRDAWYEWSTAATAAESTAQPSWWPSLAATVPVAGFNRDWSTPLVLV